MTTRADASFIEEESLLLLVLQVTRKTLLKPAKRKKETPEEEGKKRRKNAKKKRQSGKVAHYQSGLRSVEKLIVQIEGNRTGSRPNDDDIAHSAFNRPPTDTQLMNDWPPHTTAADDR